MRIEVALRMLLRWPLVAIVVASPHAAIAEYYYYCPKGNGTLVGDGHYLSGRVIAAFPTGPSAPSSVRNLISPPIQWKFTDCSDSQFLCLDAQQPPYEFVRRIFVPRDPVIGRVYQSGPARAYVTGAASSHPTDTIQVVNTQPVRGRTIALKLTVRSGVGAIFIDGINFWNALDYANGETCALESRTGIFEGLTVNVPPPRKITDFN